MAAEEMVPSLPAAFLASAEADRSALLARLPGREETGERLLPRLLVSTFGEGLRRPMDRVSTSFI